MFCISELGMVEGKVSCIWWMAAGDGGGRRLGTEDILSGCASFLLYPGRTNHDRNLHVVRKGRGGEADGVCCGDQTDRFTDLITQNVYLAKI